MFWIIFVFWGPFQPCMLMIFLDKCYHKEMLQRMLWMGSSIGMILSTSETREVLQVCNLRRNSIIVFDWIGIVFHQGMMINCLKKHFVWKDPMLRISCAILFTMTLSGLRHSIAVGSYQSIQFKLLAEMKLICRGISFSAFKDYYQMGESIARLCLENLCQGIVMCPVISDQYLRPPTNSDVKRIVLFYKFSYGIDGCLGCLNVKIPHWAICPVAWKHQFEGKEGYPIISLEAVAHHNLWIWYNAFGFVGTLNDINIWDRSPLYKSMLEGGHDKLDFTFEIDGQKYDHLYYVVDGIYPVLSCFLSLPMIPPHHLIAFMLLSRNPW